VDDTMSIRRHGRGEGTCPSLPLLWKCCKVFFPLQNAQ